MNEFVNKLYCLLNDGYSPEFSPAREAGKNTRCEIWTDTDNEGGQCLVAFGEGETLDESLNLAIELLEVKQDAIASRNKRNGKAGQAYCGNGAPERKVSNHSSE